MVADDDGEAGRRLFRTAADLLAGRSPAVPEGLRRAAEDCLAQFDYRVDGPRRANRLALLSMAAEIGGVFRMRSRHAPGLACYGATLRGVGGGAAASATGSGLTPAAAFEACIGEAIEVRAQFGGQTHPPTEPTDPDDAALPEGDGHGALEALVAAAMAGEDRAGPSPMIAARRLRDGALVRLPAATVLRDAATGAVRRPAGWGLGIAAAPERAEAERAALLEAVERDAVALWWRGGRAGRPIGLEAMLAAGTGDLLAHLRGEATGRSTSLVDLTGDLGIPVVAALSVLADGSGFAAGFSARPTPAEAMRGAVLELAQMELGHDVVAAKRARFGDAALSEADRRQERRSARIRPDAGGLVDGVAGLLSLGRSVDDSLAARLAAAGFEAYAVDLTQADVGVPVVAVLVPGLQPTPSTIVTPRLAALLAAGGGDRHGVELF